MNRNNFRAMFLKKMPSLDMEKLGNDINSINALDFYKRSYMRIQSIEVWNFRNIEHGKVIFPNSKLEDISHGSPSMLGLYGQNGSGKTSVILAISLLKDLLSGQPLGSKYESCIKYNNEKCSLLFELSQSLLPEETGDKQMSSLPSSYGQKIYYSFDITKTEIDNEDGSTETQLHVVNEVLSVKVTNALGEKIQSKQKLFDARPEESDYKGRPFGNKARYMDIVGNDKEITNMLRNAKAVAYDRSTSFIFLRIVRCVSGGNTIGYVW